jgi:hypothetical protein
VVAWVERLIHVTGFIRLTGMLLPGGRGIAILEYNWEGGIDKVLLRY